MKLATLRWTLIMLAVCTSLLWPMNVRAQDGEENERINSHLGATLTVPVSSTENFVKKSPGVQAGAGYNFSPHHSVIGEFMWNELNCPNSALAPLREAVQSHISARSHLYAVTANYRFQLQGKFLGIYVIGGGGWYYRTSKLSSHITTGSNTKCDPAWLWWGFSCTSGLVTANQTLGHFNSSVLGGSVGAGITLKVANPSYRLYLEPRYHYAPTRNIKTRLVDLTLGIRY